MDSFIKTSENRIQSNEHFYLIMKELEEGGLIAGEQISLQLKDYLSNHFKFLEKLDADAIARNAIYLPVLKTSCEIKSH